MGVGHAGPGRGLGFSPGGKWEPRRAVGRKGVDLTDFKSIILNSQLRLVLMWYYLQDFVT